MSVEKSKVIKGKHSVRTKIIIDNQSIEQTSYLKDLGCDISYERDNNIEALIMKNLKAKQKLKHD